MSNTHDGDEKIPTPSTLGRIRVKREVGEVQSEIYEKMQGMEIEGC